ncbi:ATP-binding protein [Methylicorpusculum sp.]|uniref:sensor histidine kinase n=2 Tax=Methylicorpusculum sp. TaxID=2713644 RepID=UPI002730BF3F|nr:ATP-binding protein [Methylicorpusculum sp.]MDP2176891.1 ATP-binding protein [Methylicorpusculum sp.]MDP3529996.1 ATP-binding protein [Methylicorpusculum sp.]
MSIVQKLTLSLVALSFFVFGIYGAIHLHAERQDLRIAMEQETQILASSIQVSVENALRDQQIDDVQKLLQQLERIDPAIHIRVYISDNEVLHSDAEIRDWPDSLEQTLLEIARNGETRLLYFPVDKPNLLFLSQPFIDRKNVTLGNLTVVRSLDPMNEDLQATERTILITLASFVLVTSGFCFVLVRLTVARPLERLGQGMRDFRDGNLPPLPLPVAGNDELTRVIREFNRMIAELSEAYRQLEVETQHKRSLQRALQNADKLITIGQLSAGLAHEIGTPLQIINGRARALVESDTTPDDVRRIAQILVAQTDRMTRIVKRLLDFVRHRPLDPAPCDVAIVITEVLDMLTYEARNKDIALKFNQADDLPRVKIDKDGIQQIVLNLVSNALAAGAPGGSIRVDLHQDLMFKAGSTIPSLQLKVSDTGKGITPEHLTQLFEPFFTTRADCGGTGLGLAVVKTIVTEMGGSVAAESNLGLGSCFTVDIPLKAYP